MVVLHPDDDDHPSFPRSGKRYRPGRIGANVGS
jgi:hypothetical protein